MDLIEKMRRTDFLGPEFLTWLWFRTETQSGPFDLGGENGPAATDKALDATPPSRLEGTPFCVALPRREAEWAPPTPPCLLH